MAQYLAVKSRARRKYLKKQSNKTERLLYYIQLAFVSLINIVLVLVIFTFFFRNSIVDGDSMRPTFSDKDQNILRKFGKVKRFDIIVFNPPDGYAGINSRDHFIKRVVGMPGDEISFKNNNLYINGKKYEETFLNDIDGQKNLTFDFKMEDLSATNHTKRVPPDSYFVMGDNRAHSSDSRYFGFVKKERINGIVFFRFSPLVKFRFF
ncbi:signal peptidase I [Xylocopilactobacillus apicola]|uniref:Signal peptidase I n=1 Tax=Xylocopilactobacillus apicola TaxID=2932184 RepID=A0AAU9D585_9LACO|nr:signal peptidase I [Xylocopilactobacillus apicola]BDR58648.1 signal peptidase I [Xylocopilactobacillus apicola]